MMPSMSCRKWIIFSPTSLWCSVDRPGSADPTWNPRICERTFSITIYIDFQGRFPVILLMVF